jgi:hypothetical protein
MISASEPDSIENDGLRAASLLLSSSSSSPSSSSPPSSSALLCYLQEKLDKITQGKSKSKSTMICTWIVELMLHRIYSLEIFHNNIEFDNYLYRNNRIIEKKDGFEDRGGIYVYVHTFLYIHVFIYIHLHLHTYVHIFMHISISTYI